MTGPLALWMWHVPDCMPLRQVREARRNRCVNPHRWPFTLLVSFFMWPLLFPVCFFSNRPAVDYGPSCFVENDAGGPVLDASPAVCQSLTGGTSCGWSDHFTISVSRARKPEDDGRPLGPFNVTAGKFVCHTELRSACWLTCITSAEFDEIVRVGHVLELEALRGQSSANVTLYDDTRSSSIKYHAKQRQQNK